MVLYVFTYWDEYAIKFILILGVLRSNMHYTPHSVVPHALVGDGSHHLDENTSVEDEENVSAITSHNL